jgi:hypothetical protein
MKLLATTGLALLLAFTAASADDTVSPQHLALAKEVMALNGSTAAYNNYNKNLDMMMDQLREHLPGIDDQSMVEIKKIATEEFAAAKPALLEATAALYAKHFTERDLKAQIAFYKTEAGKHFAAELPSLSTESLRLTEPFNQRFMARLREYIVTRMAPKQTETAPDAKEDPKAQGDKEQSKGK